MEHNLHRHPYLLHASLFRSGYVFLTRYREAVQPLSRAINYTNLHSGIYSPRKVLHTFFKFFSKTISSKFFWAFSHGPRGSRPPFSNSTSRPTWRRIFPFTPPLFTPTGLHYLLIFQRQGILKFLGALSLGRRCSRPPFLNSTLRATYTRIFFSASPPLFTAEAKRWSWTSNVTTTLKRPGLHRGDQPVARPPY